MRRFLYWLGGQGPEKVPVKVPVRPDSAYRLTEGQIWFAYQGRIGVGQYWERFLGMAILSGGFFVWLFLYADPPEGLVWSLVAFSVWPSTALGWKRCQDTGRPGALFLLNVIPVLGIVFWLFVSFSVGTRGPNKYGPATGYGPLPPTTEPPAEPTARPTARPLDQPNPRSEQEAVTNTAHPLDVDRDIERLERLAKLFRQGELTDEEYSMLKQRLLGG